MASRLRAADLPPVPAAPDHAAADAAGHPLRICVFNRSYWPDMGATGQLLTELADDLTLHHSCSVTVVAGYPIRETGVFLGTETRNGVSIVRASGTRLDPKRFYGRAANYVTYFLSACLAALRVPRCDVAIAMTDPPIIGLAALLAARRSGGKFVFLCQDVFPEVASLIEDFQSPLVNWVLDRVNRFLIKRADYVIVLGDTMKRRLIEGKGADPARIGVIHNWADCRALAPRAKVNPFSRAHGLDDKFVVMHAGNIGLSQSLDVVLDAAALLRPHDDIRIVFVGDGSRRAVLEERARARGLTNVIFLPYQPRAGMANSYASADLFLVSLKPGLAGYIVPSKLYGILAAGRPYLAIVEPDCEVVQITREHECGLVVPPLDPQALADAVLRVYRDRDLAAQLGARARRAALTFDRPNQVAAYATLLRRVTRTMADQ